MPYTTYWDAMKVKTREEADQVLEEFIAQAMKLKPLLTYEEARVIQLSNIGYHFGYLLPSERAQVMPLYPDAQHPIYGRFDENYSVESMLSAGIALGKAMQEGKATTDAILEAREALKKKQ